MSETANPRRKSPIRSSCSAVCRKRTIKGSCERLGCLELLLLHGRGESRRASFLALRSAHRRVMMSGARAVGTRMANMPSMRHPSVEKMARRYDAKNLQPHRQPRCSRTADDMFEPINPLTRKGAETKETTSPRHASVVISAIIICVSNCKPLSRVN